MTTLTEIRARVRTDLHDEDAADFRWASAELDRHIFHALREMSLAIPVEDKAALSVTAGSRDIDLSSLTGLVLVDSVEYPAGQSPPAFTEFRVWGDTLTLLVERVPAQGRAGRGLLRQAPLHRLRVLDRASAIGRHTRDGGLGVRCPQHVRLYHQSAEHRRRLGVAGLHDMGPGAVERLLSGAGQARSAPTYEVSPPEPAPGGVQRRTNWDCSCRDRQSMSGVGGLRQRLNDRPFATLGRS